MNAHSKVAASHRHVICVKKTDKYIWETAAPWTKEQIHSSVFASFPKTYDTVNRLPGAKIHNDIESLNVSLNIFLDATEDLITSINIFKNEEEKPNFWDIPQRQQFEKLERSINRGVFSSITAAMALVDHTRKFNNKYPIESYQKNVNQSFKCNLKHNFIHSLRNYFLHAKITKANWKIETSKQGKSIFFVLNQTELLEWKNWSSLAKQFISDYPEGINVETLFRDYSKSVKSFHDWLRSEVWEREAHNIAEFLFYLRAAKGVNVYSTWNILIRQGFIPKDVNPYMYLDRYLTTPELEEVLSLKYRSKQQVDRIIEIVDEYNICDEALREIVYKFFKLEIK